MVSLKKQKSYIQTEIFMKGKLVKELSMDVENLFGNSIRKAILKVAKIR